VLSVPQREAREYEGCGLAELVTRGSHEAVVELTPIGGGPDISYSVSPHDPWPEFEHQAGLVGVTWTQGVWAGPAENQAGEHGRDPGIPVETPTDPIASPRRPDVDDRG
jgi:hypothetical protein